MAKTLTIPDPISGKTYTLEYTRKSVEQMEKQGFIAEDVQKKPMTMLPALFAGAFLAHHRYVKQDVIDGKVKVPSYFDAAVGADGRPRGIAGAVFPPPGRADPQAGGDV